MKFYIHSTLSSTFAWAGNIYDLVLVTYVYSEIEKAYNIGLLYVSLLFSLGLIGRFFGGTYFGNISDKIGRKPVLIISTAGYAIFSGIMAFSPLVIILFLSRLIQGIFMGGEWASGTVLAYEFSPKNITGTIVGIVQSGYGIGYALTGLTYVLFLSTITVNWRLFLFTGFIPIMIIPYAFLKIPRENIIKSREKIPIKNYAKDLIKITIIMSGMFGAYFSIFSYYPTIAPLYGIKQSYIGLLMIIANIVLAFSFILFGKLSHKINKKLLIIIATIILMFAAFLSMPFIAKIFNFSVIGILLYSFGAGDWTLIPLLLIEKVPERVRGALSGTSYNLGALIGGFISLIIGFFETFLGYSIKLLLLIDIITFISLVAVLLTIISWDNKVKGEGVNKIEVN